MPTEAHCRVAAWGGARSSSSLSALSGSLRIPRSSMISKGTVTMNSMCSLYPRSRHSVPLVERDLSSWCSIPTAAQT